MFLYCGLIFDALKIMGCLSRFFKTTNGDINTARPAKEITTNGNNFFLFLVLALPLLCKVDACASQSGPKHHVF